MLSRDFLFKNLPKLKISDVTRLYKVWNKKKRRNLLT